MKVLVTGSEGMIGHKVCDLLEGACELIKADKKTGQDLTNSELCNELLQGVDFVYHIAGVKGSGRMTRERPLDFYEPMVKMNINVLSAARKAKVKKVLYVSSTAVTHDPMPGFAKMVGENYLECWKIQDGFDNWVLIRPNSVYGEYDNFDPDDGMFIPALMAKVKRGDSNIDIGAGYNTRDFTYSEDVAKLCIKVMNENRRGVFNVGAEPRTVLDVASILWDNVYDMDDFSYIYKPIAENIRVSENPVKYDYTPLEEGIKKTWEWYKEQG